MNTWLRRNIKLETVLAIGILALQFLNMYIGQTYTVKALTKDVARLEQAVDGCAKKETIEQQLRGLQRQIDNLQRALEEHNRLTMRPQADHTPAVAPASHERKGG